MVQAVNDWSYRLIFPYESKPFIIWLKILSLTRYNFQDEEKIFYWGYLDRVPPGDELPAEVDLGPGQRKVPQRVITHHPAVVRHAQPALLVADNQTRKYMYYFMYLRRSLWLFRNPSWFHKSCVFLHYIPLQWARRPMGARGWAADEGPLSSWPVLPDLCQPLRPALPLILLIHGGDRGAQI